MTVKAAASILVLLLPLVGLVLSRRDVPAKQTVPPFSKGDLFKELKIQIFDERPPAPDVALKDINGNWVRLRDLEGKVVFLNFWATWCPPCRLEMPKMEELHKEFANGDLVILAINNLEKAKEIRTFFEDHNLTFTSLLDSEGKALESFQTWSLPTTYLIDKDGKIVGKAIGYRDWHSKQAVDLFRQLIQERL